MKVEIPILEYHDLSESPEENKTFHSPYILLTKKFNEQMKWLYHNGYQTLTIDDLFFNRATEKSVVLTFDDGHISNYELAYTILKQFKFVATFFIVPKFIGQKNYLQEKQILEMHKNGMNFESHSLTHPYLISMGKNNIIKELAQSRKEIQNLLNSEVNHFSVPYGFYNKGVIDCAKEYGYKSITTEDFGYYKPNDDLFKVFPRFTIKSNICLNKFANIVEKRKRKLISDYFMANVIQGSKNLLGCRNYIRTKSFILGLRPLNNMKTNNENPAYH